MNYRHVGVLGALVAIISIVAEWIGTLKFQAGPGMVILFPLVWAILLGALVSVQRITPLGHAMQHAAARVLEIGIMIFIVRLGTLIGPHIGALFGVGAALSLQELGHIFGTVIIALPVAVALRMGRASIGATYSIDREPNLAFMAERFGGDSDEYRGSLAIYVIGSVLGALYVALLAGFLGSAHIFDPIALAMGSGVGSGSMMAAASAAIAAEFPSHKDEILAVAGASNLITEVIGVYATVFISFPLAERLYPLWQRMFAQDRQVGVAQAGADHDSESDTSAVAGSQGQGEVGWMLQTSTVVGVIMFISNLIGTGKASWTIAAGMLLLVVISAISFVIKRFVPYIPAIVWASLIGIVLTAGHTAVAAGITSLVHNIDFLAMVTPVLAYAGLSIGKDIPVLRRLSWKFGVVAIVVYTATYLSATIIAHFLI